MRKYPQPNRLEVNKPRVIEVGRQIENQQTHEWYQDFFAFLDAAELGLINGFKSGLIAQGGRTIGEEYERHGGQLWMIAQVQTWFKTQVELGKKYAKEASQTEQRGDA